MKHTIFLVIFALIGLTSLGQQRVIVDSITTDSIAKIYFRIEKKQVDTTQQIMATGQGLQQEITIRELSLKYLEKSIKAQIPLLDSIKNDQTRQYAVSQIMAQDNQYATIRADMEMLKSALKELDKIKKK